MENAQKKEKLDVRARSYKEGRPRWVGFIQDGSYLVGKAMHLSFQRGQEAWLAEFKKWWGRKQRSSFSSQTYVESSIKC